jgi:transposase
MARCLSVDLRERVVGAVEGGMSRRQAAERFGVSPASAIRWTQRKRGTGSVRPAPQGGDKRSHRIEAHADLILSLVEERPDITLEELRSALAGHGVAVAASTLWRFFRRHRMTLKKRPGTRPSRIVPTS